MSSYNCNKDCAHCRHFYNSECISTWQPNYKTSEKCYLTGNYRMGNMSGCENFEDINKFHQDCVTILDDAASLLGSIGFFDLPSDDDIL